MTMKLKLNGIDVDCIIGDLPDERERLQRLRIDAELTIDATAADTDELADTVDYVKVVDCVRSTLVATKCRMIERAAKLACLACLKEDKVRSARVSVVKSGVIKNLESAEAVYEQSR